MGRIRLVALDIDGTVVDENGDIVEANRAPIASAKDSGILFVLVTARSYPSAARFAAELDLTTPIICCSGALARSPGGGELWHLRIPVPAARTIARFADDHNHELSTTVDDVTYVRQRPGQRLGYLDAALYVLESNAAALTKAPTRMLAFGHATIAALREALQDPLRPDVGFRADWRGKEYTSLSMVHHQASKGWALTEICRRLQIPLDQTLAIGDSQQDVGMFSHAGISVAVGGAADDVLKTANHVGPPCREGAVAWALRTFVV